MQPPVAEAAALSTTTATDMHCIASAEPLRPILIEGKWRDHHTCFDHLSLL